MAGSALCTASQWSGGLATWQVSDVAGVGGHWCGGISSVAGGGRVGQWQGRRAETLRSAKCRRPATGAT